MPEKRKDAAERTPRGRKDLTMSEERGNRTGKCVIVGAGEFHVSKIPLQEGDLIIAADGGYSYCRRAGVEPDLILGDLDSLDGETGAQVRALGAAHPEKLRVLPVEKDDTDTLAAIKEGLERGYREFWIYAGLGGRLSHTIANIQCLNYLKEHGASGRLMEEEGMVLLIRDETVRFRKERQGYLSLFSLGEQAEGVTIRHMKYELDRATVTDRFPIGVSNEFIGEEGSVTVEHGTLLIILEGK